MKKSTFTPSRAYKGYVIRPQRVGSGDWFIEKDGYFIAYASSIDHAKQQIDLIA